MNEFNLIVVRSKDYLLSYSGFESLEHPLEMEFCLKIIFTAILNRVKNSFLHSHITSIGKKFDYLAALSLLYAVI